MFEIGKLYKTRYWVKNITLFQLDEEGNYSSYIDVGSNENLLYLGYEVFSYMDLDQMTYTEYKTKKSFHIFFFNGQKFCSNPSLDDKDTFELV